MVDTVEAGHLAQSLAPEVTGPQQPSLSPSHMQSPHIPNSFVSNMALLCSRCHHDLHHGRFTITMDPDGIPHTHISRAPPRRATG